MLGWVLPAMAGTVQFDNGLRVAMDAAPSSPTVTVATIVEIGQIDDPVGEEGSAHVVEHLWFDTFGADGGRTWDIFAGAGCQSAATPHPAHTTSATQCPASSSAVLLDRELARLD